MSGHCLRCYCPSCDRDPAGEMHGHNCTEGPDCIEKARNDTITRLRSQNAELVKLLEQIRAVAAEMYPEIERGPGLATCGSIKRMAEAALSKARGDT